jgi:hypothetical protein
LTPRDFDVARNNKDANSVRVAENWSGVFARLRARLYFLMKLNSDFGASRLLVNSVAIINLKRNASYAVV